MGRAPCCDKENVKKGAWTAEEDKILVDYITANGHATWRNLPQLAGLQRCGKSCRLRWANYLRPNIKRGPFTPDEETKILKLHRILGNKWATIASQLPGRTDNEVKNYWNAHLKKRSLSKDHSLQQHTSMSPLGSSDSLVINSEPPSARHMAEWETARLEAEGRLSMDSFLNQPSTGKTSVCDPFLRVWNTEVGESFRKIKGQDGRRNNTQSPTSQTCPSPKIASGSGVTILQAGPSRTSTPADQQISCVDNSKSSKPDADVMLPGLNPSDPYDSDDSSDSELMRVLLDFPSPSDMGFPQGQTDYVPGFLAN